jgi:hypothetical protein
MRTQLSFQFLNPHLQPLPLLRNQQQLPLQMALPIQPPQLVVRAMALQAMATGLEPIYQLGIETILRSRALQPDRRQALQENAGTGQHLRSMLSRQPEQARLAAINFDLLQPGAEQSRPWTGGQRHACWPSAPMAAIRWS